MKLRLYGGHFAQIERKSVVERYRSPRSGRITTIVPEVISFAMRKAPATAAPLDIPTKTPSLAARARVVSKAWPSSMVIFSSIIFGL